MHSSVNSTPIGVKRRVGQQGQLGKVESGYNLEGVRLKISPLQWDIHIHGKLYPGTKNQTNKAHGTPRYLYPEQSHTLPLYMANKQVMRVELEVRESQFLSQYTSFSGKGKKTRQIRGATCKIQTRK